MMEKVKNKFKKCLIWNKKMTKIIKNSNKKIINRMC